MTVSPSLEGSTTANTAPPPNENPAKRARKPVERLIDTIKAAPVTSSVRGGSKALEAVTISPTRQPIPKRNAIGEFVFPDFPEFRPNLSPKEVLQLGSFGGTYFRPIYSSVTGISYGSEEWKEFPADWFEKLNIAQRVTSKTYRNDVNRYNEHCGGDLEMWESSGWITHIDPYGWFQWYCRSWMGRRLPTLDAIQIKRWKAFARHSGGVKKNCPAGDLSCRPRQRQALLQWAWNPYI
jgi:hypothetical protein